MKKSKTILITGASSGFGKLCIPLFLKRGHVVIAGIRGGMTRANDIFSDEIIEKALHSGRLHPIDLHMEKQESFDLARSTLDKKLSGKLDVLINNAGYGLLGPIELQSEAQMRYQMEVNFFGPVFLTKMLLPQLSRAKGRILNISSIAGLMSFPYYGTYNASKHALEGITEALLYELKPLGIQVGLIEPGGFKTDFLSRSIKYGEKANDPNTPYYKRVQSFDKVMKEKSHQMGGDPIKVAKLMVKLSECRNVPLRTLIGTDAKTLYCLKRLIPENWRVFWNELVFRKYIFGE